MNVALGTRKQRKVSAKIVPEPSLIDKFIAIETQNPIGTEGGRLAGKEGIVRGFSKGD